ncbi:MAG: DivIVA domain-containing protein [Microthrixaceae bacterium]
MELSELTPELFEKTEFTERRRGYDIDQVETFLEETGTAVAQLLVKYRQLEERANNAEARVAEAERRLAEKPAPAPAPAPARSDNDDVERATSTLVMAKRTADATIAEADAEAERVRHEATTRAEAILSEARATATEEIDAARRRTTEVVTSLEARRDAVAAVVEGLEQRIQEYRGQFVDASRALQSVADDPEILVVRPRMEIPEDASGHTPSVDPAMPGTGGTAPTAPASATTASTTTATRDAGSVDRGASPEASARFETPAVDLTDATGVHDTAAAAAEGGSALDAGTSGSTAASVDAAARESSVIVDAEPVTGQTSDRFLRELDAAVNEAGSQGAEADSSGDTMSAFFDEDKGESGRSRFGWRR